MIIQFLGSMAQVHPKSSNIPVPPNQRLAVDTGDSVVVVSRLGTAGT